MSFTSETQQFPQVDETQGLKVVSHKREGNKYLITVQAKTIDEVLSTAAKRFAKEYAEDHFGAISAGIESLGGQVPVNSRGRVAGPNEAVVGYQRDFAITKPI